MTPSLSPIGLPPILRNPHFHALVVQACSLASDKRNKAHG